MELLTELYKISSPSNKERNMIRFITHKLKAMSIPYEVDRYGNIYATKGKSKTYSCIVAHTDEVHSKRSKSYEVVNFRDEIIFGYDTRTKHFVGIGADDKNGIWICLKCLEEYEYMKCAFFTAEEIGCVGSNRADMSFFDDCRYVLQCDRRGNSDFITNISGTELCSDDFLHDIGVSDYGYKIQQGMMTDVITLKKRGLEVSCANISCGYYNPHSNEEYTNIADLHKCHQFVRHIVETCNDTYQHTYQPERYRWYGRYGFSNHNLGLGFEDDDLFFFPNERINRKKSNKRDYVMLLDILSKRLAFDNDITIEQIMETYKDHFPELSYQDYENAYREVMG